MHLALVVLVALLAVGAGLVVVDTVRLGIGPLPTRPLVRDVLLELLPADVDRVFELGCGWGGLALDLARARPAARVEAWEAAWVPWAVATLRARISAAGRAGRLVVRRGDLLGADLSRADVVVVYLHPEGMARLAPRLAGMRPGAWVLSNTFGLRGWPPETERVLTDLYRTRVTRYRVGAVDVPA